MSSSGPVAVLVAAGMGSRLGPLTAATPKCLLDVAGRSILARALDALASQGVQELVVVTGFERRQLEAAVRGAWPGGVRFVFNPFFASTNNMASLWMVRHLVAGRELLHLHADLVFDPGLLAPLRGPARADLELVVDEGPVDEEAMKVLLDDAGRFLESSKQVPLDAAHGEWIGLTRFTPAGAEAYFQAAAELLEAGEFQAYDTAAFNAMAAAGVAVGLHPTGGLAWREVDDRSDLEAARAAFGEGP